MCEVPIGPADYGLNPLRGDPCAAVGCTMACWLVTLNNCMFGLSLNIAPPVPILLSTSKQLYCKCSLTNLDTTAEDARWVVLPLNSEHAGLRGRSWEFLCACGTATSA